MCRQRWARWKAPWRLARALEAWAVTPGPVDAAGLRARILPALGHPLAPAGPCLVCQLDHPDDARACVDCGGHGLRMDWTRRGWRCSHHPGGSHGHLAGLVVFGVLGLMASLASAQTVIPFGAATTVDTTNAEVKPGDATNNAVRVNVVAGGGAAADTVGTTVALNALNTAASVSLTGAGGVGLFLAAGTLAATLTPELSFDGGTTWVTTLVYNPATNATAATLVLTNPSAATTLTLLVAGGASHARVRASAFTSGTADATLRATANAGSLPVVASQGGPAWSVVASQGGPAWSVSGPLTDAELRAGPIHTFVDSGNITLEGGSLTTLATISNPVGVWGSIAHDASGLIAYPILEGCYANAAAPADVSADLDSTRAWCLRNGARAIQPTFAGVLQSTGNGTAGTGTPRVTIASDNTAFTVNVGTFPDNEPFNVAQFGGAAVVTGTGTSGAGIPRVTVSSDSTLTSVGTVSTVTNVANPVQVIGDVAHDAAAATVDPVLTGCYSSAAAPADVSADNDATREWCLRNGARAVQPTFAGVLQSTGNGTAGTGTPRVTIASDNTPFAVAQSGTWNIGTLTTLTSITNAVDVIGSVAHDAAAAAVDPVLVGCYASAAAPSDVSADTDAVRNWCLRNGSQVVQPAFAGILASTGTGASGTGTQRVVLATDSTLAANQSVNLAQVGGTNTVNGGLAGSLSIGGTAASNAAINQNPVLMGCETLTSGGSPTLSTTGNQRRCMADLAGSLFVRTGGPRIFSCALNALAATLTECQALDAGGYAYYVTDILVQTTTGTSGTYSVQSGTGTNCGTSTTAVFPKSGTANRFNAPIAANGLNTINFQTPIRATAGHALCVIGVATNTISIQINGFAGP